MIEAYSDHVHLGEDQRSVVILDQTGASQPDGLSDPPHSRGDV